MVPSAFVVSHRHHHFFGRFIGIQLSLCIVYISIPYIPSIHLHPSMHLTFSCPITTKVTLAILSDCIFHTALYHDPILVCIFTITTSHAPPPRFTLPLHPFLPSHSFLDVPPYFLRSSTSLFPSRPSKDMRFGRTDCSPRSSTPFPRVVVRCAIHTGLRPASIAVVLRLSGLKRFEDARWSKGAAKIPHHIRPHN